MAVYSYGELREHIGHKIVCVCYGGEGKNPENVAVECETCSTVLMDYNRDTELLCHNCQLDEELTEKGRLLGSDELVYQCVDEREVGGLLDGPCTKGDPFVHHEGFKTRRTCFADPRERRWHV